MREALYRRIAESALFPRSNTDTPKFPNDNKDFRYGTLQISRVTDSPNQWVFGASFLEHVSCT